jgi:hypothetical protein
VPLVSASSLGGGVFVFPVRQFAWQPPRRSGIIVGLTTKTGLPAHPLAIVARSPQLD